MAYAVDRQIQNLSGSGYGSMGFMGGQGPGGGAFGSKVGPIPMPNPGADLSAAYPNLSGTNAGVSGVIASELSGQLSPQTIAQIHNAAATFGVGSGMPGSGLMDAKYASDIGRYSEDQQALGVKNYDSTLPVVSQTQTVNPSLQAEINDTNAVNAAAPDPRAAASYAQQMFDKYLAQLKGPAGGTSRPASNMPWYDVGHAGQTETIPGIAGGGRGDSTMGYWS